MRPVRLVLAAVIGAAVLTPVVVPPAGAADGEVRIRKSVTDLTAQEKRDYVDAVHALKRTRSPYQSDLNYYDQFVAWHKGLMRCDFQNDPRMKNTMRGHRGPMFLPWHRQYVLLFENALRKVSGKPITVPYWDWTNKASAKVVFSDDFMSPGGKEQDGWVVKTGPFAAGRWPMEIQPEGAVWGPSRFPHLRRRLNGGAGTGGESGDGLPAQDQVDKAFKPSLYDVDPFDENSDTSLSFRNALEGFERAVPMSGIGGCQPDGWSGTMPTHQSTLHNRVHSWAGGNVGTNPLEFGTIQVEHTSPNDPVFFLHHSQIDRLWALWQERPDTDTSFKPTSGAPRNSLHDPLTPFKRGKRDVTPADVESIDDLGYRYAAPGERVDAASKKASSGKRRNGTRKRRGRGQARRSWLLCRVDRA